MATYLKPEWQENALALEFKRSVCETFCSEKATCATCPAHIIDSKTYKKMKISDLIEVPKKRRRRK